MYKHAIIKDGKVVNIVITPNGQFKHPQGYIVIEAPADMRIGDSYNPER